MAEPTTAEPPSRSRFAGALRPLASRPYRLMWMGSTTSSIGDAVVQIALVFAILHVGGTASDIGVIAAVSTVARIMFVLAGGVWADRLPRQLVMLTADAVRAVVQATLAILLLTGHAHVWELGVGAALYGAATSFFDPASNALVPETVPTAELQQANSLLGLPQSFFGIGGPAAGGVLIAVFGTGWLFAADAATFVVSLVCLALLRVPRRPMPPPASFLADLGEGWHELAIRPWYWITLIAHACGNFTLPAFFVLGPVIAAHSLGGPSAWGFISAGWGVGAIAGGLVALRVKPRRPLVVATLLTTLIALPPLTLAFSHSVAVITAAQVVFAFEVVWSNSMFYVDHSGADPRPGALAGRLLRHAHLHRHHADRLRGRGAAGVVRRHHHDAGRRGDRRRGAGRADRARAGQPGGAQNPGRRDRRPGGRDRRRRTSRPADRPGAGTNGPAVDPLPVSPVDPPLPVSEIRLGRRGRPSSAGPSLTAA